MRGLDSNAAPERLPEDGVLPRLLAGDEAAFLELVGCYHASMVRVAMGFVPTRAVAEEVAQEAWLGVLAGIAQFEGRSSLKSWIFRILSNCAKTRGERERRSVPFSTMGEEDGPGACAVDPQRFFDEGHERWAGHWASPPEQWAEAQLLSSETLAVVARAMEALPPAQRQVMSLRDVEGLSAEEACEVLGLSEANQRVLLHRARSRVRGVVEEYLNAGRAA